MRWLIWHEKTVYLLKLIIHSESMLNLILSPDGSTVEETFMEYLWEFKSKSLLVKIEADFEQFIMKFSTSKLTDFPGRFPFPKDKLKVLSNKVRTCKRQTNDIYFSSACLIFPPLLFSVISKWKFSLSENLSFKVKQATKSF